MKTELVGNSEKQRMIKTIKPLDGPDLVPPRTLLNAEATKQKPPMASPTPNTFIAFSTLVTSKQALLRAKSAVEIEIQEKLNCPNFDQPGQ